MSDASIQTYYDAGQVPGLDIDMVVRTFKERGPHTYQDLYAILHKEGCLPPQAYSSDPAEASQVCQEWASKCSEARRLGHLDAKKIKVTLPDGTQSHRSLFTWRPEKAPERPKRKDEKRAELEARIQVLERDYADIYAMATLYLEERDVLKKEIDQLKCALAEAHLGRV